MKNYKENGWLLDGVNGYVNFPRQDRSQIAVSIWNHMIPVTMHRHTYYEFALITKGCCIHEYRGIRVPLIPGDVFMIEPHEEHGYDLQSPIELINCQFFPEELEDHYEQTLRSTKQSSTMDYNAKMLKKRWNEVVKYISMQDSLLGEGCQIREASLNKQGIIHLNIFERKEIENLFQRMMREQEEQDIGLEFMKAAYLQQILVTFQRIQMKRINLVNHYRDNKREYIYQVLGYMEEHLMEKIDLQQLAKNAYWSEGYFRRVFKDITGMSPLEYFNRLRIVKSIEIREREGLNFSEAAAQVGIYDASYYNRLFKKIMGDSPRAFKGGSPEKQECDNSLQMNS